jgi:hypothetical protein
MSAAAAAADQIRNQTPDRLQATNTKCGGSDVQAPRLNVARPGQQARSRGGLPIRSCARQEKAAIACALPLGGEEADAGRGGRRRTVGRATRRGGAGVGGEERGRVEVNYSYSLAISPLPWVLFGFGSSFWWLQDVSLFLPHHYHPQPYFQHKVVKLLRIFFSREVFYFHSFMGIF